MRLIPLGATGAGVGAADAAVRGMRVWLGPQRPSGAYARGWARWVWLLPSPCCVWLVSPGYHLGCTADPHVV